MCTLPAGTESPEQARRLGADGIRTEGVGLDPGPGGRDAARRRRRGRASPVPQRRYHADEPPLPVEERTAGRPRTPERKAGDKARTEGGDVGRRVEDLARRLVARAARPPARIDPGRDHRLAGRERRAGARHDRKKSARHAEHREVHPSADRKHLRLSRHQPRAALRRLRDEEPHPRARPESLQHVAVRHGDPLRDGEARPDEFAVQHDRVQIERPKRLAARLGGRHRNDHRQSQKSRPPTGARAPRASGHAPVSHAVPHPDGAYGPHRARRVTLGHPALRKG